MGDLLLKFQQHIKKEFPFLQPANSRLLLAVSGGVDSVVLTDLFVQSGFDITIAHCNFQLRGAESDRDEAFVRALGDKYKVVVAVKRFDTEAFAQQQKLSIQEAARKLRYDWFRGLAASDETVHSPLTIVHGEEKAEAPMPSPKNDFLTNDLMTTQKSASRNRQSAIITAHHANDNIETLLINFFRGTGIGGLHGIPSKQDNVIRPLLFAKRDEIVEYAKENKLEWVEDSSNASDKYTRNYIRHQLLPAAKEIFSNAEDNLLQNIERFKEAEMLYDQALALHKSKLLEKKGNEWHVPVLKLQKVIPQHTIIWEIVKDFGFTSAQVGEVAKLLDAANGSYVASANSRVIKNRNWLIIAPLQAGEAWHILIEEGDKKIIFEGGTLEIAFIPDSRFPTPGSLPTLHDSRFTIHHSPFPIDDSPFTASTDASQIKFPLLLRKWKQGDYFYPLGMQKKKKLAKFFIDLKLSKTAKEKVWVLESDKKIIWVVGLRIDDRCKITAGTKNVFAFTVVTNENKRP